MQCIQCGANLAPAADVCATCAAPAPSPLGSPSARPARKDISWLVFILIFLPFLLLAGVRTYSAYPGDPSKAQGAIVGTAALAAGIAWVIYRLGKTRFRLTWAVSYAVLVLATMLQAMTPGSDASASTATASAATSAPDATPEPNLPWPSGWTASPKAPLPTSDGVSVTAKLSEDGQHVATMVAMIQARQASRKLADSANTAVENIAANARVRGPKASETPIIDVTWLGHPALQFDVLYNTQNVVVQERHVMTLGPAGLLCTLVYASVGPDFDAHLHAFEAMKDQFPCS